MNARLGEAMVQFIRELPGSSKFLLIEGISEDLAAELSRVWSDDLPPLAVAASDVRRFDGHALRNASGAGLRNKHPEGVCLVLCHGQQLPDRQSVRAFASVSPSDLLKSASALALLAQARNPAPMDGPPRQVRQAIVMAAAHEKPSAQAVAAYFDAIAGGEDPMEALPLLGAFMDQARGGTVDVTRVQENLRLARRRRSEDVLRPTALADIRLRASRVLARRQGGRNRAEQLSDDFMRLLQSGSDEVLRLVTFDEAREILEERAPDLSDLVLVELNDYKLAREAEAPTDAGGIPWADYEDHARALRNPSARREAARPLIDFDTIEGQRVFQRATRRKLEGLLKDRLIRAGIRMAPEVALVRAVLSFDSPLTRIQVVAPQLPEDVASRLDARRALTFAIARFRLGALLRQLDTRYGVEVDGALLHNPADRLDPDLFETADLGGGEDLPPLQLRIHDREGERLQIDWTPDLDDVAAFRLALCFVVAPALKVATTAVASLHDFCSGLWPAPQPFPPRLAPLVGRLQEVASVAASQGVSPDLFRSWASQWAAGVMEERQGRREDVLEELILVGAVVAPDGSVALGMFSPLKAEWVAAYFDALWSLVFEAMDLNAAEEDAPAGSRELIGNTAAGVERMTSAHYPAFLRVGTRDRPLLPTFESRVWTTFGGRIAQENDYSANTAFEAVVERLLRLQPEVAGHLRCLARGPGAADLIIRLAISKLGSRVGGALLGGLELFCVGDRPSPDVLAEADDALSARGIQGWLRIRYLRSLGDARDVLGTPEGTPAVHLALFTGLTAAGDRLRIESVEVRRPDEDDEVLFCPRTWLRPSLERRMLLMPPGVTTAGAAWLGLMTAIDDGWPEEADLVRVPEIRTAARDLSGDLRLVHDLAFWVATLDRYATRDSLEVALGPEVAILHQERRLSGESPLSLVISQKSGRATDRAIGRSLRAARIVSNPDIALEVGRSIREVATQGYGILALEAATTGSGINELVGHVVAFSLLGTRTTPWPLPPGLRVLLVSLDEQQHWFPSSKRADLLALAIDTEEGGVHAAVIEIKARRSDWQAASTEALDQLRQTLNVTRRAAHPERGTVHTRLWLNRIAEAAYAVARESRFKLDSDELGALERFRRGYGTLEWAGVGLVFGPSVQEVERHFHQMVNGDRVPIVIHSIRLSEKVLREAAGVKLTELRTTEAERAPLVGGRTRRRPEQRREGEEELLDEPPEVVEPEEPEEPEPEVSTGEDDDTGGTVEPEPHLVTGAEFHPPLLGWDAVTREEVRWHAAGSQAALPNGHAEIWGSSGAGKTQFIMSLLAQLSSIDGTHFGVLDFKNDYGGVFPTEIGARFLDLWEDGAAYNPLALQDRSPRRVGSAVIEMRDVVDVATRSFTRMGIRQLDKLRRALEEAYELGEQEHRWPTLKTLDDLLDADLSGVIGDLTRNELFRDGPPLGDIIDEEVIFGLSGIPGNGLTTILSAGFILSALLLKIQGLTPQPNTIRYAAVVDEAHRVSAFRALDTMVREGRSKGLAVILATQQPGDLPEVIATNAQTKVCFRLPDAAVAAAAARRLDPNDPTLAEQIRTLGVGEAFVGLGGSPPRLLTMAQYWKDRERLT